MSDVTFIGELDVDALALTFAHVEAWLEEQALLEPVSEAEVVEIARRYVDTGSLTYPNSRMEVDICQNLEA